MKKIIVCLIKYSATQICICLIYFTIAPCVAQMATEANKISARDTLWSNGIFISQISNDGKWTLFGESYDSKTPMVFLAATDGSKLLSLKEAKNYRMSSDSKWLGYITSENTLFLRNLKNDKEKIIQNISSFEFNPSSEFLIAFNESLETNRSAQIIDLVNDTIFNNICMTAFTFNPKEPSVIITDKKGDSAELFLFDYTNSKDPFFKINELKNGRFHQPFWNSDGTYFALIEEINIQKSLALYNSKGRKWECDSTKLSANFPNLKISSKPLQLSNDAQTIFFYMESKEPRKINSSMEIWNAQQKWIEPKYEMYYKEDLQYKLAIWKPFKFDYLLVGDDDTPTVKADPNVSHALLYDRLKYELQYKEYENVDLYVKSLEDGNKELVVRNISIDPTFLALSPTGRYVSYFKDQSWWVYDTDSKTTINLTKDLDIPFFDHEDRQKYNKRPYGTPGWLNDEKYIIIYDQYDIWLFEPNGISKIKITKGRDNYTKHRINWQSTRGDLTSINKSSNLVGKHYGFDKPLIIDLLGDDLNSGFAVWRNKKEVQHLMYSDKYKKDLLVSKNSHTMVYSDAKVTFPPVLYSFSFSDSKTTALYYTNPELRKKDLGTYELITYTNRKGDSLKGVLVYPSSYNPEEKYPMITSVYENNSRSSNTFTPPSDTNGAGFNILGNTTNGYFVLLPDIKYEIGQPGESALDCVSAAVKRALENSAIDPLRLGLIGFSYGGYEAAFIATQTEMFRAVVAGAAVTDLVSFYHDVSWNWKEGQAWRMENQQFRMGASYYDLKDQYNLNSALHHVENLKTPLLLWTGKNDNNINWYQSIYMFMAMRRLKKEGKLIMFENEEHVLMEPENQKMLSKEISQWFNFYLK